MRWLKTLCFSLNALRIGKNRVSVRTYIKGHNQIVLGGLCKIHSAVSLDASREGTIQLGQGVTLNRYVYLQADARGITLGDRVEINNHTIINGTGGVTIGADTLVGPGARVISYTHGIAPGQTIREQAVRGRPISIGEGAWICANAIILAGVAVGDGAVVGAGAVVTRDVPAGAVVAGAPARIVRYR